MHSVPCFSYFMEARLERGILGLPPVTKCIMRNPMPSERSIDQPIEILAPILRSSSFNEIEDAQQGLQFTASGHYRRKIGSRFVAFLGFLTIELSRIPHLVLIYALRLLFHEGAIQAFSVGTNRQ